MSFLLNPTASHPITPGREPQGGECTCVGPKTQVAPADWAGGLPGVTMETHVLGPVLGQEGEEEEEA